VTGAFFAPLRARGIATVSASKIDAGVAPAGAEVGDFFDYPLTEQFDTIIGNPPYVRFQDVAVDTRKKLKSEALRRAQQPVPVLHRERASAT
jgi:adenine-specific DNA-methyltransferase